MNANGAGRPIPNRLNEIVQVIVQEHLARDPHRFARILAEAEAAAWAEVAAAIKETMKTAILAQLEMTSAERPSLSLTASPAPAASLFCDGVASPVCADAADATPSPSDAARLAAAAAPAASNDADDAGIYVYGVVEPPLAPRPSPLATGGDDAGSYVYGVVEPPLAPRPSPLATGGDDAGIYVYGVVERGAASLPMIAGVANDTTVHLYVVGELAAVVSDVPLQEFGQSGLEAKLSDLVWLEQSVRRHQAVLDEVLALTALAPMKFATIYLNAGGLDAWLTEQQQSLRALLAWLRNRQEWGLKILVDRAVLAQRVATYSETLRDLRVQIEGKSQGAAYFLVRRIQELTVEEVERVSFTLADEVHRSLAGQSVAALLNALPSEDVEPEVQVVLNSAYLVADAQVAVLQRAVDAFAVEHAINGFRFQLTGPWPAYNFVAMASVAEEYSDGE